MRPHTLNMIYKVIAKGSGGDHHVMEPSTDAREHG